MKKFIPWARPDIGEEEIKAVADSMKSTWIGGNGPLVKEFEKKWAKEMCVRYAIAVNNGTSALLCGLQALRQIYRELTIAVPTFTFIATVNCAHEIGKKVILLDCDRRTWNIRESNIDLMRGINILMPVDVAGLPVDYDSLKNLNTPILADSAESAGARYKGERIGSQADIHTFSLHSTKTITTGEGGMITTNNEGLHNLMQSIVNQGYAGKKDPWEYLHPNIGFNYRMAEPQAALGLVQLKKLDKYVKARISNAHIYKDILGDLVGYQKVPRNCIHPYFIFAILIDNQITFCREMYKKGIQVKVTWRPAHRQPCYNHRVGGQFWYRFPNAENISRKVVSLPIYNGISEEDIKYIAETARKILR